MMKPPSVKKVLTKTQKAQDKATVKPVPGSKYKNSSLQKGSTSQTTASIKSVTTKSIDQSLSTNKRQPISQINSNKKIEQKITLPQKVVEQKYGFKAAKPVPKKSVKKPQGNGWGFPSENIFLTICQFYSKTAYDVYFLSTVCHGWRFHLQSQEGMYCWIHLKECQQIENFASLKRHLQDQLIKARQKMAVEYEKIFIKLFNYGSTKQNIPNKLIEKLNLEISVTLNSTLKLKQIPFKLRTYNFSSYLCFKTTDIQQWKYDFYTPHNMFKDKLRIEIKFWSRRYKVQHEIKYQFTPEDVIEMAIKQKAFNYYLDKNLIMTFFEGDDHFLYFFFEISALELVNIFRKTINEEQKKVLSAAMKKVPMHKKLANTEFESFVEYLKYQADFELHMSYHNSVKQIFTHCDTKVYPVEFYHKKAFFSVKIQDTFPKVDTYKLDNKMGISEGVNNLYLLDLTLKDRDKFLLNFSGFIYARKAEQKERESVDDFFTFADNQMLILEFKNPPFYEFKILIIEEFKKNLIKNIELTYYAQKQYCQK